MGKGRRRRKIKDCSKLAPDSLGDRTSRDKMAESLDHIRAERTIGIVRSKKFNASTKRHGIEKEFVPSLTMRGKGRPAP
jgi:hypothetical protein